MTDTSTLTAPQTTHATTYAIAPEVFQEAAALAEGFRRDYRLLLTVVSPNLRKAVRDCDPFIGHPGQVALNLNHAAEMRRWWQAQRQVAEFPGLKAAREKVGQSLYVLDAITRSETTFPNFAAMIAPDSASSSYRPTLRCKDEGYPVSRRQLLTLLADAYDAAREAQGDDRRAYRG